VLLLILATTLGNIRRWLDDKRGKASGLRNQPGNATDCADYIPVGLHANATWTRCDGVASEHKTTAPAYGGAGNL